MNPTPIAVLVRVYNRLSDLQVCVDAIKKHWTQHPYHLMVISNGASAGYRVPDSIKASVAQVIELPENVGHIKGTSQLLQAGIPDLPDECEFTVLLECDTWIFTDRILAEYFRRLRENKSVWASAEWIEKYYSLAVDMAIVNTAFLKAHPAICQFETHAESHIYNYLLAHQQSFMYISENMPVHIPKLLRYVYNPYHGRNRSFVKAQTVTHHLEDLPRGLEEKQLLANITLGRKEFDLGEMTAIMRSHKKLRLLERIMPFIPRSRWIKPKKIRQITPNLC